MTTGIDWTDRWLGGFCALGANGGLPVRHRDYAAQAPLAQRLTLPDAVVLTANHAAAETAWTNGLGGQALVLVRNPQRARALLLQAMGVRRGEAVGLPANASRDLVEAVKCHGARPCFLALDAQFQLDSSPARRSYARCLWAQPPAGLPVALPDTTLPLLLDCSMSLPLVGGEAWERGARNQGPQITPVATIYGLHLSRDAEQAGALIVFADARFAAALRALLREDDAPDWGRALAQYQRLADKDGQPGLARRQQALLAETARGLAETAGLPLLPLAETGALAHGVAVRIPEACEPSTFYAYVKGEQTPVVWLPELQPLHYAALREAGGHRATATTLSRWLLVPVGPDYTEEEVSHAVLGVVKAAEYTGMRWQTEPGRAHEYAQMLEAAYGLEHDAYRPLFPIHGG